MQLDRTRHISPGRLIGMAVGMIALAASSVQADAASVALLAKPTPAQAAAVDTALGTTRADGETGYAGAGRIEARPETEAPLHAPQDLDRWIEEGERGPLRAVRQAISAEP